MRSKLMQFAAYCILALLLVAVVQTPAQEVMFLSGNPHLGLGEPWGPQGIYEYADSLAASPTIQIGEVQYSPVLSHNRRFLLFNRVDAESGLSDLFVYDRQSSVTRQLTQSEENEYFMRWSPDDSRIAYATYSDSYHRIMIDDLAGNVNSIDLPTVYPPIGLSWLPDEENAIVVSFSLGAEVNPTQIYRLDVINGELDLLSDGRGVYAVPNVSPDGAHIAYFEYESYSLVIQDIADGTTHSMFTGLVRGFTSAWSPDGSKLAFSAISETGDADVAILDIRTGQSHMIPNPRTNDFSPVWSPDSSRIVSISSLESSAIPCIFLVNPPFTSECVDIWIVPPTQYLNQQWSSAATFDDQIAW